MIKQDENISSYHFLGVFFGHPDSESIQLQLRLLDVSQLITFFPNDKSVPFVKSLFLEKILNQL